MKLAESGAEGAQGLRRKAGSQGEPVLEARALA